VLRGIEETISLKISTGSAPNDEAPAVYALCSHISEGSMWWVLRTIAIGVGKAITLGEYERIRKENRRASTYRIFIILMSEVAKKRLVTCKADELSKDCPMAIVIEQYYQEGKTTNGTSPLRIFTIVGSDGQIINIQGFDLMQTVTVTVRHTDGKMDIEKVDPSDALKRIEREAGYLSTN
jgi:hypothetical protein